MTNSIRTIRLRRWARISVLAMALAGAIGTAHAQCTQWDVSGRWSMSQGGLTINLDIQQNGTTVTGNAAYRDIVNHRTYEGAGSLDGTVVGNRFAIQVYWGRSSISGGTVLGPSHNTSSNGIVGVYTGTIGPQGRIEGDTYDRQKPSVRATWYSNTTMKCKPQAQPIQPPVIAQPPAPAPPKPVKTTGRHRVPPPSETKLPDPPYIFAAPNVVILTPGEMMGRTTLVWDAGADHPYAEIWLKINGANEERILEKGKGQLVVELIKGRTYTYILTDSGTTLGTVNLFAQ